MFVRKVVKSGMASFTVALPKEWTVKNKIKKGENLYLYESDSGMLVTPELKKEKILGDNLVINVDDKNERSVIREIVASYLNNSYQVILKGNNIPKFASIIRQTANSLIGLELIEEESNKITLKNFVHLADSYPDQILRRIDNTIRSMVIDSKGIVKNIDLVESLKERDKSVNRFAYLLMRVVKAAIKDPNIAREVKLSPVDALFYWEMALHLEKIGDGVKRYVREIKNPNAKLASRINDILCDFYQLYEGAMKSFYQKNIALGDSIASSRNDLVKKCEELESEFKNIEIGRFANKIKALLSHIADISYLSRFVS